MTTQPSGTGRFTTTSWEEKQPDEARSGPRLAHAYTTSTFEGVIEGTSESDYVMYYSGQREGWGSGTYAGYEQVTGTVAGRTGTFVLRHVGEFDGANVGGRWTVVTDSGTGELAGISGVGGFTSTHGDQSTPYTFAYTFAG
ncbi:DUF3224 domain-containing protein [Actinopolymorpha sp. B17G11]|uniref:DUF3224 domain-containing protein n=1 Tax=Actinopolymorpha sp. B17G11 TaxID=3160861 RepID=UPI0032E4ECCB